MTQNRKRGPRPVQGQVVPVAPDADQPAQADPLAALRDPDEDPHALPEEPAQDDQEGAQEADGPAAEPLALVSQERWDEARREVLVAFHADTTAVGFLHKGGTCGCHYLSGVALRAVMPVQPEDDTEPEPEA